MAVQDPGVDITFEAGSDLSAGQFKFVIQAAGDGQVDLVGSAGGDAMGVLQNKPAAAGRAAQVRVSGVSKVVVGTGDVTRAAKVQSDATGKAIVAATGDHVLGYALEAGSAGETVRVLLVSHFAIP